MKYLILLLIIGYQKFFSVLLKNALGIRSSCRFYPSCSQYACLIIKKEGVLKGSYLFVKRLLSCQPFYKLNYDRVI